MRKAAQESSKRQGGGEMIALHVWLEDRQERERGSRQTERKGRISRPTERNDKQQRDKKEREEKRMIRGRERTERKRNHGQVDVYMKTLTLHILNARNTRPPGSTKTRRRQKKESARDRALKHREPRNTTVAYDQPVVEADSCGEV